MYGKKFGCEHISHLNAIPFLTLIGILCRALGILQRAL